MTIGIQDDAGVCSDFRIAEDVVVPASGLQFGERGTIYQGFAYLVTWPNGEHLYADFVEDDQ